MRRFMLNINQYYKDVVAYTGDKRVIRTTDENLCCGKFKLIEQISFPALGIALININYCPVCGRKIRQ